MKMDFKRERQQFQINFGSLISDNADKLFIWWGNTELISQSKPSVEKS